MVLERAETEVETLRREGKLLMLIIGAMGDRIKELESKVGK